MTAFHKGLLVGLIVGAGGYYLYDRSKESGR